MRVPFVEPVTPVARTVHTTTIPSSTRYLEKVRSFVSGHALAADLPLDTVEQFKIAVDEACANVIEHAYRGEDHHEVDIAVIIETDRFIVRIRDKGVSFDQSQYKEPNLLELTKRGAAGGLGVHIIRRLMDRVEYKTRGRVNEISLTKYTKTSQQQNGV